MYTHERKEKHTTYPCCLMELYSGEDASYRDFRSLPLMLNPTFPSSPVYIQMEFLQTISSRGVFLVYTVILLLSVKLEGILPSELALGTFCLLISP